jgi:hypothetical protein
VAELREAYEDAIPRWYSADGREAAA